MCRPQRWSALAPNFYWKPALLNNLSRDLRSRSQVSDLVLMIGVLYVVVVAAIQVCHDGRRDPRWNDILDYTSVDGLFENLTGHGREMIEMKV